jgi:hypothetical protein
MLAPTVPGLIRWRFAGSSVSGSRKWTHSPTAKAISAIPPKIQRHPASAITAWPKLGASIGTTMNTVVMVDIIRAIRSPAKRSRMIAPGSTVSPALPTACSARTTSSAVKSVTSAQARPNTM